MLTCDEATAICDKNQYGEASISEKISLTFHLLLCKYCKKYTKQNDLMTKLFGRFLKSCDEMHELSAEDKVQIEKNLKKELKKN
jgi:hypothetical protein